MGKYEMSTMVLLIVVVLLMGTIGATPVFANFCQISNIAYNYPQQVMPSQNFRTAVNVSGACADDLEFYYSIRVDLGDMSGQVLSSNYAPIGYGNGQNWQVTVPNQITAPTNVGSWQIQFNVYVFASINSGNTIDSKTSKPVTIQVSISQTTQSVSSVVILSQTTVPTTIMTSPAPTSISSTETARSILFSEQYYRIIAALFVIILLVTVVLAIKQRRKKQTKK